MSLTPTDLIPLATKAFKFSSFNVWAPICPNQIIINYYIFIYIFPWRTIETYSITEEIQPTPALFKYITQKTQIVCMQVKVTLNISCFWNEFVRRK